MNANFLNLCANVVEILSFKAPPSRAVVVALRLVQVTTVSVINDSHLAVTISLCWGLFKTRNGEMTTGTPVSLNSASASLNGASVSLNSALNSVQVG